MFIEIATKTFEILQPDHVIIYKWEVKSGLGKTSYS